MQTAGRAKLRGVATAGVPARVVGERVSRLTQRGANPSVASQAELRVRRATEVTERVVAESVRVVAGDARAELSRAARTGDGGVTCHALSAIRTGGFQPLFVLSAPIVA